MVKHGVSHAAAALVGVVVSDLIAQEVLVYLPTLRWWLDHWVMPLVLQYDPAISRLQVSEVLLLAGLTFVWGVAFKVLHSY